MKEETTNDTLRELPVQAEVRLADKPLKCANCSRIIGDEVEYGGKSPTDGVFLCADCFDFAKGNDHLCLPEIDKFDNETAAVVWKQLDKMNYKTPREYEEYANILCKHHKLPFSELKLYEKHFIK